MATEDQNIAGSTPEETELKPAPTGNALSHTTPELPRIRTYADDLSEQIRKRGSTLSSIVGAERERSARELALSEEKTRIARPEQKKSGLLLASLVVLLLFLGGASLVGAYIVTREPAEKPAAPSIIFANKRLDAPTTTARPFTDILAGIRNNTVLSLGEIAELSVTIDGATTTDKDLLRAFGAPSALVREAGRVMIGVHSYNRVQPFLIIEIAQYDRAFGAMLSWEEEIGRSFGAFFRPLNGGPAPTTLFKDAVYKNIDIRQSQDTWPIVYAFPRRDILVITTNTATLQEIMTRLSAQSGVR